MVSVPQVGDLKDTVASTRAARIFTAFSCPSYSVKDRQFDDPRSLALGHLAKDQELCVLINGHNPSFCHVDQWAANTRFMRYLRRLPTLTIRKKSPGHLD
jgi:hypothetical protein